MGDEVLVGELMNTTPQPLPKQLVQRRQKVLLEDITVEAVEEFLTNLSRTGLIYESAMKAGLSYPTVNRLKKEDDEFKMYMDEAMEEYRELLQRECHRRAIDGWDEPVFSQRTGQQMGVIRKYDMKLLELMLKRHIPEFREKFEGEIKISGGVLVAPITPASNEDWAAQHGGKRIELVVPEKSLLPTPDSDTLSS